MYICMIALRTYTLHAHYQHLAQIKKKKNMCFGAQYISKQTTDRNGLLPTQIKHTFDRTSNNFLIQLI